MALSEKERAMMDAYFEKQGLAPLWTNIKKIIGSGGGGGASQDDVDELRQTVETLKTSVEAIETASQSELNLDDLIS